MSDSPPFCRMYLSRQHAGRRPDSHQRSAREVYKRRNLVERCFNRLKQWRGIATRYGKIAQSYEAAVALASLLMWAWHLTTDPRCWKSPARPGNHLRLQVPLAPSRSHCSRIMNRHLQSKIRTMSGPAPDRRRRQLPFRLVNAGAAAVPQADEEPAGVVLAEEAGLLLGTTKGCLPGDSPGRHPFAVHIEASS
ncbi:transposase [Streptomyces anulatus]|uniref:transposase n=1 Tax=Streptomyces anulatus TaxID=1892 RepID=UPI003F4DAA9F